MSDVDYRKMTVPQLKEELRKRKLIVSGTRPDLLSRLQREGGVVIPDEEPKAKKQKTMSSTKKEKNPSKSKSEEEEEDGEEEETESKKTEVKETKKEDSPAKAKSTTQGTLSGFVKVTKQTDDSKSDVAVPELGGILQHLTDESWRKILAPEFKKPYFQQILSFLDGQKKQGKSFYPPEEEIFSAFNHTPFDKVKAVILGQDPYHDDNQAHGMCFSVKKGIKPPPSLKNIYKELTTDIKGFKAPDHGFLQKWADEGVLLLNATLTVEPHKANSHKDAGWMNFTDEVIKIISKNKKGVVFLLWGGFAQKKDKLINANNHHILKAAHPSPLGQGKFFGCKCFSKTNEYLKKEGQEEVDWTLPESI